MSFPFQHPYRIDPNFSKRVAYFCMEFGIHQPLKTYSGGLGFLAGSHMRSAWELKQNMVGIGILWKYGYYDQVRKSDQCMDVLFQEKVYGFLKKTKIKFTIKISGHDVWVTAWYLPPEIFKTAPVFLLSADLPENDYLSKTNSHKLYDANPETQVAASILLGVGGAKLLEKLNWIPDVYHLNESHALPLYFYLYNQVRDTEALKKKVVFTNHTPEEAGNKKTPLALLDKMSFFGDIPLAEIKAIAKVEGNMLDHTLTAIRLSGRCNAVSKAHLKTLQAMWSGQKNINNLTSVTNAQDFSYWHNNELYSALAKKDDNALRRIKQQAKHELFEVVADQCGEIYDERVLTIVFAKRFAGYKRADLLLYDMERFHRLVTNTERPVQIISAGKPYPMDYAAIGVFDRIADLCKTYCNCAILVGYELKLSMLLKRGADVWLNVPRITHEASGTSGMSAAMNGAVNLSIPDGWFPEFARDKLNGFVIPPCDPALPESVQDEKDNASLYQLLEQEVIPMYYDYPARWLEIMKNGMKDIIPAFGSNRLAAAYYEKLYSN
ncbi:MAG TPA: alpha-glucan family phosphorylase [Agriterribacter sp.]|nr:alpha-glucan family phosphorylase [Agriterribacter sp.]